MPDDTVRKLIGLHYYPPEATRDGLLSAAARHGEAAKAALAEEQPHEAAYRALQAASCALDATESSRSTDNPRIHTVWTPENGNDRPPVYGDVLAEHRPWGWKVVTLATLREHRGVDHEKNRLYAELGGLLGKEPQAPPTSQPNERAENHKPALYAADVYAVVIETGASTETTPRNITFGFWETWKHNNRAIPQPAAWTAVFRVHGSGGTWPEEDRKLAAVLDTATGRHYADTVAQHQPENEDQLDAALRDAGDPRDLWARSCRRKAPRTR